LLGTIINNKTDMKKIIFSLAILSFLVVFSSTKAWAQYPTVGGNVTFSINLVDGSWTSETYDLYVRVVANSMQASSWVYFATENAPTSYGPYTVYISDIPYPSPIYPNTYRIYVKAERSDGRLFYGWSYATPSYSPFALTANSTITVQ
jgi:hypothetical protein